ncbi:BON domain-containing protein [Pararhodospirillum photometricum]|uniref:BON domain-containing protein n=1 Tax=Pararhodospirillum photometricum TaxID=1084 RepID=UPI0002F922D2|nr:BON domain-containing protein [Pararhodospirillum photometricum]
MSSLVFARSLLAAALALGACAETASSDSTGTYIDDSAITAKVKMEILKDDALKVMQIDVTTQDNVVQLSGFVDSSRMVSHAGAVARQVSGVRSVRNNLIVK